MSDKVLYHVNPDTGRVGVCKAVKKPCKFVDGVHAESKDVAKRKYERIMSHSQFKVLKRKVDFVPTQIKSVDDVSVVVGDRRYHDHLRKNGNEFSENLWFEHNGETIGFVKIMRHKVYWDSSVQNIPLDNTRIDSADEDGDNFYTVMCDIEVRTPGLGHGRFILEKLTERCGDVFISGNATQAGVSFNNKNLDLLHQDPSSIRMNGDIRSPKATSSFDDMNFVSDWDNKLPKFKL